jgi:hypothetical protein
MLDMFKSLFKEKTSEEQIESAAQNIVESIEDYSIEQQSEIVKRAKLLLIARRKDQIQETEDRLTALKNNLIGMHQNIDTKSMPAAKTLSNKGIRISVNDEEL